MSAGGADDLGAPTLKVKLSSVLRVHQQAITVLEVESGRIVSGSHDTTLKVIFSVAVTIVNCQIFGIKQ